MIFRLMYCSSNCIRGTRDEVDAQISDLLAVSRRNNQRDNITGALLFNGRGFAQVLEGPEGAVRVLYGKIVDDPRNTKAVLLDARMRRSRVFSRWSMAFVGPEELESLPGAELNLDLLAAEPKSGAAKLLEVMERIVRGERPCGSESTNPAL